MKALALDFDGVLADSAAEIFAVALRTYRDLVPATRLAAEARDALRARFDALMPLGNRAEDFGVALAALDARRELADQSAYDRFRDARDAAWRDAFHHRFYEVRAALVAADPAGWCALNPPYRPFLAVLRRHAHETRLAIATAKDRASVLRLLDAWGARDLFDPALVLDKETAVRKCVHLGALAARLGLSGGEITFIDDKPSHLDDVAGLGVRCALAAWGHNGPREHALARAHGHLVCSLDDVEAQLW